MPTTPTGEPLIDAAFPGGNAIIERVLGDTVELRPDLRDTDHDWFYWCFRVRQATGRTLKFHFTAQDPIGVRGPAVSLDGGWTWRWLGAQESRSDFSYAVPADANDVRFGMGMTYTQMHLDAFMKQPAVGPRVRREVLCTTRKGRAVERLRFGPPDGRPRFRLLVTARHHCCEMMGSYELEGLIAAALADDELGRWFAENVDMRAIPFVDKDGVEDGDQGKYRAPRDHNRDYDGQSIHVETAALRETVPAWIDGVPTLALDLHCPWLWGENNEVIYQVGRPDPQIWSEQQRFGAALEQARRGPLPYRQSDDLPFGQAWNTTANGTAGASCVTWASGLPGVRLATTIELPYANAGGAEVNQATARAWGRDVAAAIRAYLEA